MIIVRKALNGVDGVVHTAALQKPHIGSHSQQAFVETNISGTLILLEEADVAGAQSFVFTSSTSAFGRALSAEPGAPANWITEKAASIPRNIYGVTKTAAENLCELVSSDLGLPVVILRTARFFPEPDDLDEIRLEYVDENVKVNEYLHRRVDIEDAAAAHLLALAKAPSIGFANYIVSATTPFDPSDMADLASDAPGVVQRLFPDQPAEYVRRNWRMFPVLDRVYDNSRARIELDWAPLYDFRYVLNRLKRDDEASEALWLEQLVPRDTTTKRPGYTQFAELCIPGLDSSKLQAADIAGAENGDSDRLSECMSPFICPRMEKVDGQTRSERIEGHNAGKIAIKGE